MQHYTKQNMGTKVICTQSRPKVFIKSATFWTLSTSWVAFSSSKTQNTLQIPASAFVSWNKETQVKRSVQTTELGSKPEWPECCTALPGPAPYPNGNRHPWTAISSPQQYPLQSAATQGLYWFGLYCMQYWHIKYVFQGSPYTLSSTYISWNTWTYKYSLFYIPTANNHHLIPKWFPNNFTLLYFVTPTITKSVLKKAVFAKQLNTGLSKNLYIQSVWSSSSPERINRIYTGL